MTLLQGFGAAATPTANQSAGSYTGSDDDIRFTFRDSGLSGKTKSRSTTATAAAITLAALNTTPATQTLLST